MRFRNLTTRAIFLCGLLVLLAASANCLPLPQGDVFSIPLLQMAGAGGSTSKIFAENETITANATVQNKANTQNAAVTLEILDAVAGTLLYTSTLPASSVTGGGSKVFSFPVNLSAIAGIDAGRNCTVKAKAAPGVTPSGAAETSLANNRRSETISVVKAQSTPVPEIPLAFVVVIALGALFFILRAR